MTMTYNGDNGIQIDGNLVINNYPENSSMDFDLIEFESLINDMYSCCFNKSGGGFDFVQIKIEEKNRINKLEFYFNEKIKKDIVYFKPLHEFILNSEDDFRAKVEYVAETIRSFVIEDGTSELTQEKIQKIIKKFYEQKWNFKQKQYAIVFIHYLYFICLIGKKE